MNRLTFATWASAFFMGSVLFSNTVTLRLSLLLICMGFAVLAVVKDRASIRVLPPLWLAFALWAGWAWLSLAWSIEPERSIKELRNETVYVGLAFWTCFMAAQARGSARVVLPVVGAAAVLLCALALYQFPQGLVRNGERWHGGAGNLSTIVLILLPCALMAAWYGQRCGLGLLRNAAVALAVLLLAAAYTTLNRTIWVGIAFEIVLIAGLLAVRDRRSIAPRAKLVGAAAVLLVVTSAGLMSAHIQAEREHVGEIAVAEDPRLKLWPEVVDVIKERPMTGYGFGRGVLRGRLGAEFNNPLLWHAHNVFLDMMLQLGLPGVLLLLVLIGATVLHGWRFARATNPLACACGIAVLAVVAGMLIRNMTDMLWVRHNALVYWAVLGVLFAWGDRGGRHAPSRDAT